MPKRIEMVLQPKQLDIGALVYKTGPDVATWIGGGGARAGGKSGGLRRIMLERRYKRPGTAGVIVRRTFKDVNENHIQKYFTEYPELVPYWRATDNEFRLPNKSRLCFRYYENKQAVDQGFWGPEWYDVFIDQAEQFTEYELTIARSACRWPGAPMNDCKLGLFFNPGGVGTEFLRRVFHQRRFNANENPANYAFVHLFGWDNYVWFESLGLSAKEFYALPDGVRAGADCPAGSEGDKGAAYRCCRFHLFIHGTAEGQKLNALPPSLRAGHLLGSFDSFAGQYFAGVWDESKLILTAQQEAKLVQSWWGRWMAHDDGFVHHAALGWFVSGKVSPKLFGEVFGIEIPEAVTVVLVYRNLVESEVEPGELVRRARKMTSLDEARTLSRYFLSVDAWEKDSKGHSVAEEITKELLLPQRVGDKTITFPGPEQADNARIGGWRYLYAMMKKTGDVLDGKMNPTRAEENYDEEAGGYSKDTPLLFISSSCQDIIEAIPMAIRDDIHAGRHEDIIKLPTKADDVLDCFAWNTPIRTEFGQRYIYEIQAGERVWTRQGLKRVVHSWKSRVNAPIVKARFSNGAILRCTDTHRFWVQGEFKPLRHIRYDDKLSTWNMLNLQELDTIGTRVPATTAVDDQCYIGMSGRTAKAISLRRLISITRKMLPKIPFISKILNASLLNGTYKNIQKTYIPMNASVEPLSWGFVGKSFAPMPVSLYGDVRSGWTMNSVPASSAGSHSVATDTTSRSAAEESAVRLVGLEMAGYEDVYDLEVKDANEFFADGILVHNCLRYGVKSALRAKITPFPVVAAEKRQEMELSGLSMTEMAIQLKKLAIKKFSRRHSRKGSFR